VELQSVSPVAVMVSLATAPISPAWSWPTVSWSLPWSSSSWPIRSASLRVAVPGLSLALQRAGQDPQVGQPADERIGGRLEDAGHDRAVHLDRRA
jgi:hypothetical protein